MKRKILALLLSLAMLLSIGGMVEGTLAVGISVDSTRSSVMLGEVNTDVTPASEATMEPTPEATPETTPDATPAPDTTPAPEDEGEATPTPTVEPTPAPEEKAEHIEGCSDDCAAESCACTCHAAQKTPADDFASMTDEELYAYVKQLSTDEEIEAFLKQLPEERLNALVAYAQAQEPVVVPETVVFTDAGPFMPPVTVERVLRRYAARAAAEEPADTGNGLELSKTATANGDGTYTIRMEAYTTGEVITSTKTVPVDIVLVLDQSGSMAYDFNGNETNKNSERRQYAMKEAMKLFIATVAEKYSTEADHRMAIVTFGSSADTLQGWTYVDETGKTTLQNTISRLPDEPSGATNVAAGMSQAETLMMGNGYSYTGTNTQRQKVVIVFTDGVPTTSTDFNTTVATNAIASAKNLKDADATVYTIGIFNGANPNELHGEKWDYAAFSDITCNGEVGDYWGGSYVAQIIGSNDFEMVDIAAGNRFLNYLSSNFTNTTKIGLTRGTFNPGNHYIWVPIVGNVPVDGTGYRIDSNFTRSSDKYYLTANDTTSLNDIFQEISDNIQSANIDLGSETVVKDTVSKYFDLPAKTSDVKLYTAAAKADGSFESAVPANGVNASFEGNAVSVTGFDFNANFVSENAKTDGSYGKKLIIEFTVTPKDGFIGGNDVPTNDWEKTAVYDKDGKEVEKFADANTTPTVNVPIDDVTVTAADKNVYLKGEVTAEQLKDGAEISVGDVKLNLSEENYGLQDWQTKYVDITVTVKDKDGNVVTDSLSNLTEDTTYTISVTVTPKTEGAGASGTANSMDGKTGSDAANINVFKPELTFKDSTAYYGEAVPANNDYSSNKVGSEVWKHGDITSTDEGVTMLGTKPSLEITYTPDSSKIVDGKYTKQDVPVKATVKIGTDDVSAYTTFIHQDCTDETWTGTNGDPAFMVHIKTCTLTITKAGEPGKDLPDEPFVFTVKKDGVKYTEVTIVGNGSETICELPVGTYTIAEDTGWSWRFTPSYSDAVTLSKNNASGTISCTNTNTLNRWLNGFSDVVTNIFGTAKTANN